MSVTLLARGSAAGNLITLLLLVGIVGLGAVAVARQEAAKRPAGGSDAPSTQHDRDADSGIAKPDGDAPVPIEPVTGTPTLEAANDVRAEGQRAAASTSASTPATAA